MKLEANITRSIQGVSFTRVWLMSQPVRKLLLNMCDWLEKMNGSKYEKSNFKENKVTSGCKQGFSVGSNLGQTKMELTLVPRYTHRRIFENIKTRPSQIKVLKLKQTYRCVQRALSLNLKA